ncbi:hypothetical protein AKO1_007799 [Acrasis kona]|uniref:RCC1-like domain-containing protein n=1 Tax=Acrasis kona TaxID=1008807 RepID=A0AAW2YR84_9EUKA
MSRSLSLTLGSPKKPTSPRSLFPISPRKASLPPPSPSRLMALPTIKPLVITDRRTPVVETIHTEFPSTEIVSCGANEHGQCGQSGASRSSLSMSKVTLDSRQIIQVSCGANHCIALNREGNVFSWGANDHYQLGLTDYDTSVDQPLSVQYNLRKETITKVCAGSNFSAAISDSGKAFTWGLNHRGQLGHGDDDGRDVPERVRELCSEKLSSVACGDAFIIFVTSSGSLYSCGENLNGELGLGAFDECKYSPEPVPELVYVKKVCAGAKHCIAITKVNSVYAWGDNSNHQLALGPEAYQQYRVPTKLKFNQKIKDIGATKSKSILLCEYGIVYVYGGQTLPVQCNLSKILNIYCSPCTDAWLSVHVSGSSTVHNSTVLYKSPNDRILSAGLGEGHIAMVITKDPVIKVIKAFYDIHIITRTQLRI